MEILSINVCAAAKMILKFIVPKFLYSKAKEVKCKLIKNFSKRAAGKYLKKWGFNNKDKDVCVCERERMTEKKHRLQC